jgi:alcohol dehydrogenase (nicotinoprotein)
VRAGDTVVIFGAGGVGSNAVQGARYAGAKNVIVVDPVEFKRETATTVFGATHAFATAKEAHDFVIETTWGQGAEHAILTPGVVTEEMVNAAVQMTGKGGKTTITAVGHADERAVHVTATRCTTSPGCCACTGTATSSLTSSSAGGTPLSR